MFVLKHYLTEMAHLVVRKRLFIGIVMVLTVILNFGLAVRMHYNSTAPDPRGFWSNIAEHLYNYGVYSAGDKDAGGNLVPTSIVPPLYVYICFFFFSIAGITAKAFILIKIFSILMTIGTVFFAYRIGALFSYRAGCIATLVAMLDLNLICWANNPEIPDAMLSFLLALSYFYLLKFTKVEQSCRNIIAGSLFLGLALLTKPVAYPLWLPLSVFLLVFMILKGKSPRQVAYHIGLFLMIPVIFVGGWQARNYAATGNASFYSMQGDVLLNHAVFMKAYQTGIPFTEVREALYAPKAGMDENAWNAYSTRTSLRMILDSPFDYTVIMLRRTAKLLMGSRPPFFLYNKEQADEMRNLSDIKSHLPILKELWSRGHYGYLFWLGYIKLHLVGLYLTSLGGIILLVKNKTDRAPLLLLLLIMAYFISVSVPSADFRYRNPVMPLFYFLSGYAWSLIFTRRSRPAPESRLS